MAYGCLMECIPLTPETVNTHREKPKVRQVKTKHMKHSESFSNTNGLVSSFDFRTVGLIEPFPRHLMNFSKNQLRQTKSERKVKLCTRVRERKSKQSMLMAIGLSIMLPTVQMINLLFEPCKTMKGKKTVAVFFLFVVRYFYSSTLNCTLNMMTLFSSLK